MTAKMRPAFSRLHAVTLDRHSTPADLAEALTATEAVTDRHRLSEGAVYATACRRYLLTTGRPWVRTGTADATASTWGGASDHRYRLRARPDGSYDARCSCGAAMVVFTPADGDTWHADHTAGRIPGQEPA
ncbi:hypothetical protein Pam4_03 [Pseudanabaena phage Pam4]|nr:hypothetical protein Pam4_03 [Pseudanabaena phage Pam4]